MVEPLAESIENPAAPRVKAGMASPTPLVEVRSLALAVSEQYSIALGLLVPDKVTGSCWTVAAKQGEEGMRPYSKELAERAVGRCQDS